MDDVGRSLDLLPTHNASLAVLARSRSHVMVESECVPTSHLSHDLCALRVIAFDNIRVVEKVDRRDRQRALQQFESIRHESAALVLLQQASVVYRHALFYEGHALPAGVAPILVAAGEYLAVSI